MKVSLSWLKRYVDIDVSVEELCDKMTMSGFEVEGVEDLSKTMDNVVAARILKKEKHPDADKLSVCQMDVGTGEPIQIITGADNIFEGALVPAALHDSHLPNGVHIKKGKLRGLPSNGMMCSGEELCLKEGDYPGAEVHGILILEGDWAPGTDMREVLGLTDVIIDFSILSNRPDCNSVLGIAREVAVVLGKEFHAPVPAYKTVGGDVNEHISVTVEDYDLCPRYVGRVVKNLRIGPSPEWMKQCLKSAGVRSINNIVDITNFVMLETGQPMHAFDLNRVKGHQIIVRHAKDGEPMTTLDGKDHTLNSEMLVIADAENPSCLAGIMGGLESEIENDTADLFLECAKFRRDNVRRTARTLGMRTESSARFEKGVDVMGTAFAMDRALQLIDELDCGDIIDGVIDRNAGLPEPRTLTVTADDICALLGVTIPEETIVRILNSLQIATTVENGVLHCVIPSFREDIEGRADLSEEAMRVYGYEHIVSTPMEGTIIRGRKLPERVHGDTLKKLLCAAGMREIATYSFISAKAPDMLSLPADDPRRQGVALLNPLSEEYAVMRTQLTTSMLTVLATNASRKIPSARFFELSKLFVPKALPLTEQPDEVPALSIGMYGPEEDFFTLKGVVEAILDRFHVKASFVRSAEPYLHPGRQAKIVLANGEILGYLGEVHPLTAENFGLEGRVYAAELKVLPLYDSVSGVKTVYKALPKHPASVRDLAVLADAEMPVADIAAAISSAIPNVLEKVELFDVYQGKQVPEGKKSVAYSITLRAADRTLTVEECDNAVAKVMKALDKIGVTLRQ
ncbi:MAG: phenylalanine--tRNA ligase subunit beta [Oscillospiraceae bacterium]|nr:phenylalanine--tRNA ligase subunit beta [Oscillospiraceae bacterium]